MNQTNIEPVTEAELARVLELDAKATPPPWKSRHGIMAEVRAGDLPPVVNWQGFDEAIRMASDCADRISTFIEPDDDYMEQIRAAIRAARAQEDGK